MRPAPPRSFRGRILLLATLATSVAIVIEGVVMRTLEIAEVRPTALGELSTDAAVIATHSAAPLAFGDRPAAVETLDALRARPNVIGARIYDARGRLFGEYWRDGERPGSDSALNGDPAQRFDRSRLRLEESITHEEERLGTLVMLYDLSAYYGRVKRHLIISVGLGLAAVGAAVLVALRLQRGLTVPVAELVQTSRRISSTEDFSLRVRKLEDDELGELADSFNAMIARIQQRDEHLVRVTRALEDSNEQLQQFAYVASHDLQEPLRKIQTFASLLTEEHAAHLNEEGRDYLERMRSAADRMRSLITDLLTYSRVTSRGQELRDVDLGEVVEGVLDDLEARIDETGGRVEVGALPTVRADALHLRQLMQNLIGNGLKFHRDGVAPIVTVSARRVGAGAHGGGIWELTIADNGIGFEQKYADRIFAPFERLHGRAAYEGTGMGLAVCKRIVERHGWGITARAEPDGGATFTITCAARSDSKTGAEAAHAYREAA